MDEEGDQIVSFCADLVTQTKSEPFLISLFRDHSSGDWVQVRVMCQNLHLSVPSAKPELVATWLADPFGDQGFAVIIFYDDESKQSFAAHYNKQRLLEANQISTE